MDRVPSPAMDLQHDHLLRDRDFAGQTWVVLAPLVMKEHYGGAFAFGVLGSMFGIGLVFGGIVALRWHPSRPLLVSCVAAAPYGLGQWLLAFTVPYPVLLAGQVAAGFGLAIHLAL